MENFEMNAVAKEMAKAKEYVKLVAEELAGDNEEERLRIEKLGTQLDMQYNGDSNRVVQTLREDAKKKRNIAGEFEINQAAGGVVERL